jgi:hypothetical protein
VTIHAKWHVHWRCLIPPRNIKSKLSEFCESNCGISGAIGREHWMSGQSLGIEHEVPFIDHTDLIWKRFLNIFNILSLTTAIQLWSSMVMLVWPGEITAGIEVFVIFQTSLLRYVILIWDSWIDIRTMEIETEKSTIPGYLADQLPIMSIRFGWIIIFVGCDYAPTECKTWWGFLCWSKNVQWKFSFIRPEKWILQMSKPHSNSMIFEIRSIDTFLLKYCAIRSHWIFQGPHNPPPKRMVFLPIRIFSEIEKEGEQNDQMRIGFKSANVKAVGLRQMRRTETAKRE